MPTDTTAVRLYAYGDRDVLRVEQITVPDPGPGEVLVAVRAAGINPGEAAIRRGDLHSLFPATFPTGEGTDLAGVVVSVGPGVTAPTPGEEVLGWSEGRSSHAGHVVVPATQLIAKPAALSWEQAGALFVAGTTAWAAVETVAPRPGETVVVSAAAGGVGGLVAQLLVERGAHVVAIASPANAAWLSDRGATPVAYGEGLLDRVRAAAPDGVDALIDLHGPAYLDLALELQVPPERIETIISFARAAEIGAHAEGSAAASDQETLRAVAERVADGRLELEIAATYPLSQVREAFAELEQGHTRGKVVLICTPA